MSDINPLGSTYFSGLQNVASETSKNQKKEKVDSNKKLKFSEVFKSHSSETNSSSTVNIPENIKKLPIDQAIVLLKDSVDIAGDNLASSPTAENIEKFRKSIQQFIQYVIDNNFETTSKGKKQWVPSRTNFFSNYELPPHRKDPRVQIQIINQKVDELVKFTLSNQKENMKILSQIDEIKGLIVDLIQS